MEANFFRALARDFKDLFTGCRIGKIHAPAEDAWTIKIQNKGCPPYLLFRPAKSAGLLFLSEVKPANPMTAPARAMWFRKRVSGRRILACLCDWPNLQLAFELSSRREPDQGRFLVMDMRQGLSLVDEFTPSSDQETNWPELQDLLKDKDIWRDYPQISPPLRRVLNDLAPDRAATLLEQVRSGQAVGFFIPVKKGKTATPLVWRSSPDDRAFKSALEAEQAFGQEQLFPELNLIEEKPELARIKSRKRRVRKNLDKLDREYERLNKMKGLKIHGEALQSELYKIKTRTKLEKITVDHPEHGPQEIELDPKLSPLENMERFFKLAAKAERGFKHLARRRNELGKELARLESGIPPEPKTARKNKPAKAAPPKKFKGLAVALFTSSDGFLIIRGKNKKANHEMLSRAASPFDYWLHVADGPSSHVILKRDHPVQEVPQKSLQEAAVLCGLKSWRSEDGRADVMVALVKDVRKIKGAALGQVSVDNTLTTLRVDLDQELEDRLSPK